MKAGTICLIRDIEMREIIDWLIDVEDMAADLYRGAAMQFRGDSDLSDFLNHLAEDEQWHSHILATLQTVSQKGKDENLFISFDRVTKNQVEEPFDEKYKMLLAGALTRESLLDCIIEAEFSELNHIFLYIVKRLNSDERELMAIGEAMKDHLVRIKDFMGSQPDSQRYMERIDLLPDVMKKRVLVVEDYRPVAELLVAVLEEMAAVELAANGREALEKVSEGRFDVVISDVQMPEMDGIEFYKEAMKTDLRLQEKILMFTGSPEEEHINFIEENNLRYLRKPADIHDIRKAVKEILDQQ